MTRLFDMAACRALHMSRPKPPKISIGIEISQPPMDSGLSSIQRSMNIGGEPHKLAYINSEEADLLHNLGGSGQPVNGIPAFAYDDPDAPSAHGIADMTYDDPGYMSLSDITDALDQTPSEYRASLPPDQREALEKAEQAGQAVRDYAEEEGKDWFYPSYYDQRAARERPGEAKVLKGGINWALGLPNTELGSAVIDAIRGAIDHGYWGPMDWQRDIGMKFDYPQTPSDIDTDPTITPKKKKAKEKEKEKEKSAMEKYLDSIAGRDDDDSDDDDVSERQKWWDDLPDYLKDILRNTYPEEDEYGMPKDLFTDSV